MSFFESANFIDAFRDGGCFIFEGEDDPPEVPETENKDGDEQASEPATEDTSENTEQPEAQSEQPKEQNDTPEDLKQNTADTVNSDSQKKVNKPTLNADQIAKKFKESGALKQVLTYAGKFLRNKKGATERDVLPYIKSGIEKFCQQQAFSTDPTEIANAIKAVTNSLGATHAKAEQAKAAEAAKKQKAQQAQAAQKQGGGEGAGGDASGGEAPAGGNEAPSGGEEAPATPDAGGGEEAPKE